MQQNSSISEGTASSSEELSVQATQLQQSMEGFYLSQKLSTLVEVAEDEDIPKVGVALVPEPKVIPKKNHWLRITNLKLNKMIPKKKGSDFR